MKEKSKEEFLLRDDKVVMKKIVQMLLLPLTGVNLMARCLALEIVSRLVEMFSSLQEEKEIKIDEDLLTEEFN